MKSLIPPLICLWFAFSCSTEDKTEPLRKIDISESSSPDQFPQKWQLIKMSGTIIHSETTGTDMAWQEYYRLNSDSTFVKHRERDGIITEASGKFYIDSTSSDKFLQLIYNMDNDIIGSCFEGKTESLWYFTENKLIGTWSFCDGPGLEYERTE
jgi:hypothetical protein